MRRKHIEHVISRFNPRDKLTVFSKIAGVRCPNCSALQSIRMMNRTNPYKGVNKADAHECPKCQSLLYLDGKKRILRYFLMVVPTFILSLYVGYWVTSQLGGLHSFHEARGHDEPNFWGFLVIVLGFIYPSGLFLTRFESVSIFTVEQDAQVQPSAKAV